MRLFRVLTVASIASSLAACLQSTTLVKINRDGSGTVEQTTLLHVAALKAMVPGAQGQLNNPVTEDELRRNAARMGKGVRVVSTTPVKSGGFEGVAAVFAFDDINQVQVTQGPAGSVGAPGSPGGADDPARFTLERKGGTSVLTIALRDAQGAARSTSAPPAAGAPQMDPTTLGMLKPMFQGLALDIALEVAGTIVKTNAAYVSGSRVTLVHLDGDALFADETRLRSLPTALGPGASFSEVRAYLKDFPGVRIDGPTITVEFR
jgi:hypothetical protein